MAKRRYKPEKSSSNSDRQRNCRVRGWQDGKEKGVGTLSLPDGSKYVGEYKVGKKDGQGTYTYANGNNYIVEWKDREYVGWGTYTRAKGSMFVR